MELKNELNESVTEKNTSQFEFIALMACLMSMVALSVDGILPALQPIGLSLHTVSVSENQSLITMVFLGLGSGQLILGPISDSYGRKPILFLGFIVYVIASFICITAGNITIMILGRILQGFGLSAHKTISISMIRDRFEGNQMARIMSFVIAFFILVPMIAPFLGKLMLESCGWRSIFYSQLIFGSIILIWLWKRQPETLQVQHKKKFSAKIFISGTKQFFGYRSVVIYTLISGIITGPFIAFLSSSQHIFEVQYNLIAEFPYIFGALALSVGLATFTNGILVVKFGMKKLVITFMILSLMVSTLYTVLHSGDKNPSITILIIFLIFQFCPIGFLSGNIRSLAMQRLGSIAGIGAAISGFISTVIAVPIATFIGNSVRTAVLPIFIGFASCGLVSAILFFLVRRIDH